MTNEQRLEDENRRLRGLLWERCGCPVSYKYADDGEMQCQRCKIDFKRFSIDNIESRFAEIGFEKLKKHEEKTQAKTKSDGG